MYLTSSIVCRYLHASKRLNRKNHLGRSFYRTGSIYILFMLFLTTYLGLVRLLGDQGSIPPGQSMYVSILYS